jgi:hypothetical protein
MGFILLKYLLKKAGKGCIVSKFEGITMLNINNAFWEFLESDVKGK